jgi:hypothetical protein
MKSLKLNEYWLLVKLDVSFILKVFFYGIKAMYVYGENVLNFLRLWHFSLMWGGRLLKTLMPIQYTPFW